MDTHSSHLRAVRPPPSSRRALFSQSSRRQNPTTVRPDLELPSIFQPPQEDQLVERNPQGEYVMYVPQMNYKHITQAAERDEEAEQEAQLIDLYGKPNAHWDPNAVEEEIKGALKSSLGKKVASMEEDAWMFQGDADGLGKK